MTENQSTSPETNDFDPNETGAATERHISAATSATEHLLTGGGQTAVAQRGDVVLRPTGAWTLAGHALLRHLEAVGYDAAPRLVGTGFDPDGREAVRYIPGVVENPRPWRDAAMPVLGRMLRALHEATATFQPLAEARWRRRFSYELGGDDIVIGHSLRRVGFAPSSRNMLNEGDRSGSVCRTRRYQPTCHDVREPHSHAGG